ncbi:hypothetical protein O3P69_006163 [Scylla paramamosain]|uniref:Uncharacterized protein n=1 Tax=Scylla paramamosain TaxID=85552 RepID=A0AAW0U5E5_SCYPA
MSRLFGRPDSSLKKQLPLLCMAAASVASVSAPTGGKDESDFLQKQSVVAALEDESVFQSILKQLVGAVLQHQIQDISTRQLSFISKNISELSHGPI